MEPTQEQIKEFWGRYGWEYKVEGSHIWWKWDKPNQAVIVRDTPPPIDLNNLFKYAVPKVIDKIMEEQECSSDLAYGILFKKWLWELELDMTNPDTTLYHTCSEAMKK